MTNGIVCEGPQKGSSNSKVILSKFFPESQRIFYPNLDPGVTKGKFNLSNCKSNCDVIWMVLFTFRSITTGFTESNGCTRKVGC